MEVKKDLIGKKTPSLTAIAKKHGVSLSKLRRQLAMGTEVEYEHTKSKPEAKEIARDHLDEFPDYYTRLHKMEKKAEKDMKEAWVDPIEVLHNENRRRILQGAKEGKFWLVRSEALEEARRRKPLKYRRSRVYGDATSASSGGGMRESERDYLINKIMETTTSGAIGGFPKPMGGGDFSQGDPAFGGRNRFTKEQLEFAIARLLGRGKKFVRHPVV
jgi:hypothetical protein